MQSKFFKFDHKKTIQRSPKEVHRYLAWLISKHSNSEFVKKHELELVGIPLMIGGLEYHFKNFIRIENKARKLLSDFHVLIKKHGKALYPPLLSKLYSQAFHEIGAYLCVLGRIEAMMTSHWIQEYLSENEIVDLIKNILSLMPLRNKYFAHRSYDDPLKKEKKILFSQNESEFDNKNDLEYVIQTHLLLGQFGEWRGQIGEPMNLSYEIKIDLEDRNAWLKRRCDCPVNIIEFFKKEDRTGFIHFIPKNHHGLIISEIRNYFYFLFSTHLAISTVS